ncbi:TPA: 30S ribosomal protein S21 [bacterium]|nr:30S ribosomal protein S21 [bacterium]
MTGIDVRNNESMDNALRRFKIKCLQEGIPFELKKRAYYEKPSIVKKRRKLLARRKKLASFYYYSGYPGR